jgi:hypothetical protein
MAGARGGHGTTTIATVLALLAAGHHPTQLVSGDAAALLGWGEPSEAEAVVEVTPTLNLGMVPTGMQPITVIDMGQLGGEGGSGIGEVPTYVVLRGPCYLALRTLVVRTGPSPAGIILVVEDGRSLTDRDVEDVLGVPVVARIQHSPGVARTIDAGLLVSRLHRLTEFRDLTGLARRLFGPTTDQALA